MRTETELQGREILAIWVKGCVPYVSEDYSRFTNAIKKSRMGKNGEKRDFLKTNLQETHITQGGNNIRRSCTVVFLDKLPQELKVKLKESTQCLCTYIHNTKTWSTPLPYKQSTYV